MPVILEWHRSFAWSTISVFASGLMGAMSGSVITNVLTTGVMSIPAMKRLDLRAIDAGGEACASTGGVLMPPDMGATAFVMATFLEVPYSDIVVAPIFLPLLYYFGLFMQIYAYSARYGLKGLPTVELPGLLDVIEDGWYFIFVLIMLLYVRREAQAPYYATATSLVINQLSRRHRQGVARLVDFLMGVGRLFTELAGILAEVGLIIGVLMLGGRVGSLAYDLVALAGNDVFLSLLMQRSAPEWLGVFVPGTEWWRDKAVSFRVTVQPGLRYGRFGLDSGSQRAYDRSQCQQSQGRCANARQAREEWMGRLKILRAVAAAAVLGIAASAATMGEASAKTLKSAVGLATSSAQFYAHQRFAEYVAKNSDLKIKVFSMSLLNLKETPPGVRDGIADMGFVLPPYYPAEYAENNLVSDLSMLSTSGKQVESPGAAMAGATSEYTYFHCPECLNEYAKQNQVYLGTGASPTYIMLCTKPLRTLEDLKGKKYRSGAANFGRWAEYFGGIKVSIPGNDVYEAMGQGVIDCAMLSATELTNLSLFDLTKFVTRRIPGGVYSGVATINVNIDTWRSLTTAQRKVFLQGAARINADLTWKYYSDAKKNLEISPSKGIEVIEPGPEILKASDEFVKGDLKIIAAQFMKDYGIKNVDPKIARITELVEKWKGLTANLADDADGLSKLYWEHIFSKIDPATFGMK